MRRGLQQDFPLPDVVAHLGKVQRSEGAETAQRQAAA